MSWCQGNLFLIKLSKKSNECIMNESIRTLAHTPVEISESDWVHFQGKQLYYLHFYLRVEFDINSDGSTVELQWLENTFEP